MDSKKNKKYFKKQLTLFCDFFRIPTLVEDTIVEKMANKNDISFHIISYLFIIMEIGNIIRLIFFTTDGIRSLDGLVYFTFYCILILGSILFLMLRKIIVKSNGQTMLHFSMVVFIIIWNVLVNAYDLSKSPINGITGYLITILSLAIFIQLKPFYILLYSLIGYVVFSGATIETASMGIMVNMTIATLVSATVAIISFRHVVTELTYQKEIIEINNQLKMQEQKLILSLNEHRIVLQQSNQIMLKWYLEKDEIEFSENWNKRFGYPSVIPNFTKWLSSNKDLNEKTYLLMLDAVDRCKESDSYVEMEINFISDEWYLLRISMLRDSNQNPYKCIGILSDIKKQKEEIIQLKSKLQVDHLTNLLNKQAICNYANDLLDDRVNNNSIAMYIIDVDNFKTINDTYGHPCGDYILIRVANILKATFKNEDGVGRIGGDEFAVITSNCNNSEDIKEKAIEFKKNVSIIVWENQKIKVGCSIGIVATNKVMTTYENLYKDADSELYKAKALGKNTYSFKEVL